MQPPPPFPPPSPIIGDQYDHVGFGLKLTLILHVVFQAIFPLPALLTSGPKDALFMLGLFGVTQIPYMFVAMIWALVTARIQTLLGLIIGGAVSFLVGFVTCLGSLSLLSTR